MDAATPGALELRSEREKEYEEREDSRWPSDLMFEAVEANDMRWKSPECSIGSLGSPLAPILSAPAALFQSRKKERVEKMPAGPKSIESIQHSNPPQLETRTINKTTRIWSHHSLTSLTVDGAQMKIRLNVTLRKSWSNKKQIRGLKIYWGITRGVFVLFALKNLDFVDFSTVDRQKIVLFRTENRSLTGERGCRWPKSDLLNF